MYSTQHCDLCKWGWTNIFSTFVRYRLRLWFSRSA